MNIEKKQSLKVTLLLTLDIPDKNELYKKIETFRRKMHNEKSSGATVRKSVRLLSNEIEHEKRAGTQSARFLNSVENDHIKDNLDVYDNLADYTDFLSRLTKDDGDLDNIYESMRMKGLLGKKNTNGLTLLKKSNDIADDFNNSNFLYYSYKTKTGHKKFVKDISKLSLVLPKTTPVLNSVRNSLKPQSFSRVDAKSESTSIDMSGLNRLKQVEKLVIRRREALQTRGRTAIRAGRTGRKPFYETDVILQQTI